MVLVYGVGIRWWCMVMVYGVAIRCWYTMLYAIGIRCWYTVLVYGVGIRCWYMVLAYGVGIGCWYAVWYAIPVLFRIPAGNSGRTLSPEEYRCPQDQYKYFKSKITAGELKKPNFPLIQIKQCE
jgi:hypothetical protein